MPAITKGWAAVTWKGGYKVVRVAGALFLVNYRNDVDRHLGLIGGYDRQHMRYLTDQAERHGFDIFLDIGSNLGYYAVLLARHPKVAKVLVFEPDIRNFHHLCGNLYLNQLSDVVSPHLLAVGNINGQLRFVLNVDMSSGGSHVARSGEQNVVDVQSVRLDDFLPVTDQTLFFKIDVEEHELAVFEGATRLLENNRCLVQVESFGKKAEEVKTFFKSIGHEFRHNFGPDYFFDNFRD